MTKKVTILNTKLDTLTFVQSIGKIGEFLDSDSLHYGVTPNSEILLQCLVNSRLNSIVNQADISTPDGAGLLWAAKYNTVPLISIPVIKHMQAFWQLFYSAVLFSFSRRYSDIIPERVTGTDMVPEIAKLCAEKGKSLFLLGAGPGVAQETATRLQAINPKLVIAGISENDPTEDFDKDSIQIINNSKADCLLIAYGAPKDQYWIERNKDRLKTVKFVMGIGGAFDFISQKTSVLGGKIAVRAPQWMRDWHLEWLHRLYYQPDRIGRIFNAVIKFPITVAIHKIKK